MSEPRGSGLVALGAANYLSLPYLLLLRFRARARVGAAIAEQVARFETWRRTTGRGVACANTLGDPHRLLVVRSADDAGAVEELWHELWGKGPGLVEVDRSGRPLCCLFGSPRLRPPTWWPKASDLSQASEPSAPVWRPAVSRFEHPVAPEALEGLAGHYLMVFARPRPGEREPQAPPGAHRVDSLFRWMLPLSVSNDEELAAAREQLLGLSRNGMQTWSFFATFGDRCGPGPQVTLSIDAVTTDRCTPRVFGQDGQDRLRGPRDADRRWMLVGRRDWTGLWDEVRLDEAHEITKALFESAGVVTVRTSVRLPEASAGTTDQTAVSPLRPVWFAPSVVGGINTYSVYEEACARVTAYAKRVQRILPNRDEEPLEETDADAETSFDDSLDLDEEVPRQHVPLVRLVAGPSAAPTVTFPDALSGRGEIFLPVNCSHSRREKRQDPEFAVDHELARMLARAYFTAYDGPPTHAEDDETDPDPRAASSDDDGAAPAPSQDATKPIGPIGARTAELVAEDELQATLGVYVASAIDFLAWARFKVVDLTTAPAHDIAALATALHRKLHRPDDRPQRTDEAQRESEALARRLLAGMTLSLFALDRDAGLVRRTLAAVGRDTTSPFRGEGSRGVFSLGRNGRSLRTTPLGVELRAITELWELTVDIVRRWVEAALHLDEPILVDGSTPFPGRSDEQANLAERERENLFLVAAFLEGSDGAIEGNVAVAEPDVFDAALSALNPDDLFGPDEERERSAPDTPPNEEGEPPVADAAGEEEVTRLTTGPTRRATDRRGIALRSAWSLLGALRGTVAGGSSLQAAGKRNAFGRAEPVTAFARADGGAPVLQIVGFELLAQDGDLTHPGLFKRDVNGALEAIQKRLTWPHYFEQRMRYELGVGLGDLLAMDLDLACLERWAADGAVKSLLERATELLGCPTRAGTLFVSFNIGPSWFTEGGRAVAEVLGARERVGSFVRGLRGVQGMDLQPVCEVVEGNSAGLLRDVKAREERATEGQPNVDERRVGVNLLTALGLESACPLAVDDVFADGADDRRNKALFDLVGHRLAKVKVDSLVVRGWADYLSPGTDPDKLEHLRSLLGVLCRHAAFWFSDRAEGELPERAVVLEGAGFLARQVTTGPPTPGNPALVGFLEGVRMQFETGSPDGIELQVQWWIDPKAWS